MEIVNYIKGIKQHALSTPDKVMIVDENGTRRTTYTEFWTLTEKIAAQIRATGSEGKIIPIVLPDCMEYFAAEVAIWMTGNCAVNLGSSFPQDRILFITKLCQSEFMIDNAFVDQARQLPQGSSEIFERQSNQPCIMFFTSGSTGNPKGVLHTDEGFLTTILRFAVTEKFTVYNSFTTIAPNYFVAVGASIAVLYMGMTLHLLSKEVKMDPAKLLKYIAANQIETAFISPSILQVLTGCANTLKVIFTGSERLVGCYSESYRLFNCYGQTETSSIFMYKEMDRGYDNSPVGKPVPGIEVCLIDEQGHEVADGELGELCIKSGFPAPKYFMDPVKTQELTAGGVQHTGDLMKRLPNGDYLYVQRKDWMVKINGQRVEPGEIETVMKQIAGVKDAVVKGFTTDDLSRQYLVGYYILDPAADLDADKIEAELKKRLPAYMVPQYMVQMESFPLNANFKVDRKNLKSPAVATPVQTDYVAPANEVEKALCAIFAAVLNLEKVGATDDFALIGGDSIRAMKVQQTFNDRFANQGWGVLAASTINLGRTPRKIAELLANSVDYTFEDQEDYPLNTSQLRYVANSIVNPDKPVGILANAFQLDDVIDLDRMARTLEKVAAAHKAFGIRVIEKEPGVYRQTFVDDPVRVKPEKMTDEELAVAVRDLYKPVAVLGNRLFKMRLIETPSGKYLLMMMHHSIVDGTSNAILMRDIVLAYDGNPVPAEEWSQLEIAQVEQQFRQSDKGAKGKRWFEERLKDIPQSLPAPDVKAETPQAASRLFTLEMTPAELKAVAKRANATLNVYTTTVFARLMGQYTGKRRVALWLPYASRDDYRSQNTVGQLANSFILNTSWDEGCSLEDHLKDTNMYFANAMSYVYADRPTVDITTMASILYQGEKRNPMLGGKPMKALAFEKKAPMVPTPIQIHLYLDFTASQQGTVTANVIYHAHRYSEQFIERMVEDYTNMLKEGK